MLKDNSCVHCGADCGKHPVIWDEKLFCCNGCKQVYQLLNENKLNQYYNFEQTPGIKIEKSDFNNKYAFLDKDEIKENYYQFYQDNIAKVTFYIPSIHCASCIWLLEHINKLNKGIKNAAVNFIKKEYTVTFNTSEISLRELVELLSSIHYVPDLSAKKDEKQTDKHKNKTLLYKIGLSGFVFGNVMLYSLPEYFNGAPIGDSIGTFLYYLTYFLTIPLVFYSGSDYLVSAFKNLIKGLINIDLPIAIGILTLFFVTSYEVLSGNGPGYSDSLAGFLFFLLLGKWYQSKTYQALSFDRDYKSYFPIAVTKIKSNNTEESVLLEEIQENDILLIHNKELIPADSTVIEGAALIDYSFVTGESTPVKRQITDFVYAGGIQTGGAIKVKVKKAVKQSHLTQLWNQSSERKTQKKSLTSIVDKISIYFTLAVITIATIGFLFWLISDTFSAAILVLTSILIVACPCALALSLPFTFGNTMRILGNNGFYLKNVHVIEKLTQINTVVLDKTGTLTVPDESDISYCGDNLNSDEITAIASLVKQSVHPLSYALTKYFKNYENIKTEGFVEMPGKGIYGKAKNLEVKLGSYSFASNSSESFTIEASAVHISINNNYKGYYTIKNKYRQGFESTIKKLNQHFGLHLISGDNNSEQKYLSNFFAKGQLHFNKNPQDKMQYIKQLQSKHKKVLMTGDGLNDAGAFLESDVALSIADDVYHFSPAGDAIVDASKFNKLYSFINYSRKSLTIVKLSFAISITYNLIGLGFAITGNLSPVIAAILMPISSVSVVAFATFSTRILAKRML